MFGFVLDFQNFVGRLENKSVRSRAGTVGNHQDILIRLGYV